MKRPSYTLTGAARAAALALPLLLAGAPAHAAKIGINLVLQNGWTNAPSNTYNASAISDGVIVSLSGAIKASATSPVAFTLPSAYTPQTDVFAHLDLCNGYSGWLHVFPTGKSEVVGGNGISPVSCVTSLDGVSFARSGGSAIPFTALTLQSGWSTAAGASAAQVRVANGVVQFRGAIAGGGSSTVATLPAGMRPAADVYIPIVLSGGGKGRIKVAASNGTLSVFDEGGGITRAKLLASLDGASYVLADAAATLPLQNGWTNSPWSTRSPAAQELNNEGIIRFQGGMSTSGTNATAFTLPVPMRPVADVFVPVDLCSGHGGWLHVRPTGAVSVEAPSGQFSQAQCFTSLEGAWFTRDGYVPLSPFGDWTVSAGGNALSASNQSGTVVLRGTIESSSLAGTGEMAFVLPTAMVPQADVYVPLVLCSELEGYLYVTTIGKAFVDFRGTSVAHCAASLEGVSFARAASGYTALTLVNGWFSGPLATSDAAVRLIKAKGNVVTFKGGIGGGSSGSVAFTLPSGMRPSTSVNVPIALYNGAKGHLAIQPSGAVTVEGEPGDYTSAPTFTSLDGASFVLPDTLGALAPQNGWVTATGYRAPRAQNLAGAVRFEGAVSGGTNAVLFTLPAGLRPAKAVYLPVDLCHAAKGQLYIQPSGSVTVQTQFGFADAQCLTSLEGASFVQ